MHASPRSTETHEKGSRSPFLVSAYSDHSPQRSTDALGRPGRRAHLRIAIGAFALSAALLIAMLLAGCTSVSRDMRRQLSDSGMILDRQLATLADQCAPVDLPIGTEGLTCGLLIRQQTATVRLLRALAERAEADAGFGGWTRGVWERLWDSSSAK